MLIKLHRKIAIKLLLIIPLLVAANQLTMAEESATVNKPINISENTVAEEYQQELSRLDAISRTSGGDLMEMEKIAQKVQDNRSRLGEQRYLTLIWTICRILCSHDFGLSNMAQQKDLARKYATSALQQNEKIPLRTEIGLLLCMLSQAQLTENKISVEMWITQRGEEAKLWFHAWQQLNAEIDPNFDFSKRYPQYINPPPGYENYPFPVPPDVIKDPKTRADYEAAIKENRQKAANYARQSELRDLKKYFLPFIEKYLVAAYSTEPYDMEELKHNLNLYVKDESFKKRVLAEVDKAIQHNAQIEKNKSAPQPQ